MYSEQHWTHTHKRIQLTLTITNNTHQCDTHHASLTSNTHKRIQLMHTINTHTQTHPHTPQHYSPLKSSVVSDVSDLRPSPMYCAPMSPILLPVHPTHTPSTQTYTHHIIHHSLLKFSVVSNVSDLRPSPMYCAPMSPMLFTVHPNTITHSNNIQTNKHTNTHITSSLTTQIQCCKGCE